MNKRTLQVLVALSLLSASSYAAKERVVRFQNHVRVGYDDNIYKTTEKTSSAYITDIINLSGKFTFSTRTDALIYWEPEFQYRLDAEPKFVTYQNLYGRLNHAVSQRLFLTLSDRFRYQQKEGQAGVVGGGVSDTNSNYIENDLLGSLNYQLNEISDVKVGAGYEFRVWDDENYGTTLANDYQQLKADASYLRQFIPNRTLGVLALNYVNHEFEGSRGGYDAVSALVGVDQNFNPNLTGFGRVGASFNSVDNGGGVKTDTTSPYLQGGMSFNPTARTSLTGSLGYSMYRSENSVYNAQDRFNIGLGARHDITAKINIAAALSYIYSFYDGSYVRGAGVAPDAKDDYYTFSLRCAYQINRNNFVEAGYLFSKRTSDTFNEWDGNRVDVAWRLRL